MSIFKISHHSFNLITVMLTFPLLYSEIRASFVFKIGANSLAVFFENNINFSTSFIFINILMRTY